MDTFIGLHKSISTDDFKNPHYFFLIGKHHLREERFSKAIEYFDSAIRSDPNYSEFAEYYKAGAIVKQDSHRYQDAIKCMKRSRHKLMSRMLAISSFPRVMQEVKELQQKSGKSLSSDLYSKQIESRMEIYNAFLNSVTAAVGADGVDIAGVVSAHCSEDQASKFQKALLKHEPLFRTYHVLVPEFDYSEEELKTKLKGCDFSKAVKSAIAAKILTNRNKITAAMFEDILPNVDNLFLLLESSGILVTSTVDYREIKEVLCVPLTQAFVDRSVAEGDMVSYGGALCLVTQVSDEFDFCVIDKPKKMDAETKLKIRFEFSRETGALVYRRNASTAPPEPIPLSEPCMTWRSDVDMSVLSNGNFKLTASEGEEIHLGELSSLDMDSTPNTYAFTFVPLAGSETGIVVTIEFDGVSGVVLSVKKGSELLPPCTRLMFRENAYSTVRRGCQPAIERLFAPSNKSFADVYTGMDEIKETLLAQAGSSDEAVSTMLKIRKSDVQMLTKKKAAEKLVGFLETKCVLSPPNISNACKEYSACDFEVRLRDCLGKIIRSEKIKEPNKLLEDYVKVFETFKMQLACDLEVKYTNLDAGAKLDVSFTALREDLQDGFNFSLADELSDMELRGLSNLVKFIVKPPWWGPLVVFLLGVAQVIAGAVISALGFPNVGLALISEGVGDMIFAIEAQLSGEFSWSDYLKHKLISLTCSIITCGVGSALTKKAGVTIAKAGFKTVVKKVAKKVLEAVATALSGAVVDKVLDTLFTTIVHEVVKRVDILSAPFAELERKLRALYAKTGDRAMVTNYMKTLVDSYFGPAKMFETVSRYIHQFLGAIATGIGNAAKVLQKQGGKFKALAEAAKAFQKMLKFAKYTECIMNAISEMVTFILSVGSKVDLHIHQAVTRAGGIREESDADCEFIHAAVNGQSGWKDMMQRRVVDQVKDGILKPEIKHGVNSFLHKMGREIKEGVGLAGRLEDTKYKNNLLKARTANLSALASTDAVFSKRQTQCPLEIIAKNNLKNVADLPDDQLLQNGDGHTAGSIREMIPGVVFYRAEDGRLLILPPDSNNIALSKIGSDAVFDRMPRYKVQPGDFTTVVDETSGLEHEMPVVDGAVINLNPIGDHGLCREQVRLFKDKLARLREKHGDKMTQEEMIAKAKSYAEKPHKAMKLRYVVLSSSPDAFRGNDDLRRFVGSVDDAKVGYVSFEVYMKACLIMKRKNYQSPHVVNDARHCNEHAYDVPHPNRLSGPEDRTLLAQRRLNVLPTQDRVSLQELKDVLAGNAGTEEEKMHLRACAGLFADKTGKFVTNPKSNLFHQLQTFKHLGDPRNVQMINNIKNARVKQIKLNALAETDAVTIQRNYLDPHSTTDITNILSRL
jgi:hypothetical protein